MKWISQKPFYNSRQGKKEEKQSIKYHVFTKSNKTIDQKRNQKKKKIKHA